MKHLKPLITAALLALALLALPGSALAKRGDRDHDRMADRWERRHHLNTHARDARRDPDHDGLRNLGEFRHRTDPHKADTDDDGLRDRQELRFHSDPSSDDSDDDGVEDGDEMAGTIESFENGLLTIRLAGTDGQTVSGMVDESTECEIEGDEGDDSEPTASASHDGSDDSAEDDSSSDTGSDDSEDDSSNSGPGSDSSESGDDSGDDGESHDVGDDHGDDDGDDEHVCTSDDLVAGARVHEAELSITDAGAVFTKIELIPAV